MLHWRYSLSTAGHRRYTFQYLIDPIGSLRRWRGIADTHAMLILTVPQTINLVFNQQQFNVPSGHYYHYTINNLVYMLAVNGWDCANGFFKIDPQDPWLYAIVYKSEFEPLDPRTTSWYDLCGKSLLPETFETSINKYGHPKQPELVLPWLDKSLSWLAQQ